MTAHAFASPMTMKRRLFPLGLAAVAALALVAPTASAQDVPTTVLLHDLFSDGSYVGCHVTNPSFATYRATVKEGQHVVMTVQAPENNTNVHYLTVEGVDGQSERVTAGQSTTFEFDVTRSGSRAVRCDGQSSNLQGVLVVRAADAGGDGGGDTSTPAPGALLSIGAVVAVGLIARRAHRRGDA